MRQAFTLLALFASFVWTIAAPPSWADIDERWNGLVAACVAGAVTEDALRLCRSAVATPCTAGDDTTMGLTLCLNEEANQWRAVLDNALAHVEQREPPRAEGLRAAQTAWLAWFDAECNYRSDPISGGSGQQVALVECVRDLTADRAIGLVLDARAW